MRIIAGRLGGRYFDSPGGRRTHPMSDKVRGALFNALGDITGLRLLDAFSGSGALAFEALSRGAAAVTLIESDRRAQKTIAENIRLLGLPEAKLIAATAGAWLETSGDNFDVVLADPPYDNVSTGLLERLAARTKTGGVVVFSLPPQADWRLPPADYEFLTQKEYGDAVLCFYRRR